MLKEELSVYCVGDMYPNSSYRVANGRNPDAVVAKRDALIKEVGIVTEACGSLGEGYIWVKYTDGAHKMFYAITPAVRAFTHRAKYHEVVNNEAEDYATDLYFN